MPKTFDNSARIMGVRAPVHSSMTQALLDCPQITSVCQTLRTAFGDIRDIRANLPFGNLIQLPRIPPILTESWVAHEISDGHAPFWQQPVVVMRGGPRADLLVRPSSGPDSLVEVKGTGNEGFSMFSAKDISTDVLVWVSFAGFFDAELGTAPKAYWLKDPGTVFTELDQKITLPRFRKRGDGRVVETTFHPVDR